MRAALNPTAGAQPAPSDLELREVLAAIRDAPRAVAAIVLGTLLLGAAYLLCATPVYRSDILLQVEDPNRSPAGLQELTNVLAGPSPAEAEIEIIRSRAIVGAVVDELGLDIVVRPRRIPLVGGALARRRDAPGLARAPLGLSRFAWGGEQLAVQRFEVPAYLEGERFELVAQDAGRYLLRAPDGAELLRGAVGEPASGELGGRGGRIVLVVTRLQALPGTHFHLGRERRDEAIRLLQEHLAVTERGKSTGILRLSLMGTDAPGIARTLDALARQYLRKDVERRSAEVAKTLEFVDSQLPLQKAKVDSAEAALEMYRSTHGNVDLTMETQSTLDRVVELEKQLSVTEMETAALRQRFTAMHPMAVSQQRKASQLKADLAQANEHLKKLPRGELQSARLQRDVKVSSELYLLLLNKAQELRILESGTLGNIRILDTAPVPFRPVRPSVPLVLGLSLLLGLSGGAAYAHVRQRLHGGVRDPVLVEAATGLSVYASVPHSAEEAARAQGDSSPPGAAPLPALAAAEPGALAVESLRSLRTSLQFALAEARNNAICVSGPRPDTGKSFVALNLAHVLAQTGKRVLLVDADLRKGRLHRYFSGGRARGLTELIRAEHPLEAVLRRGGEGVPDFLPSGAIPPNPAELLESGRFAQTLAALLADYELVLLDVPPLLAVTDGALVARHAGVNLLVLRHGCHAMREISLAIERLAQGGVHVNGLVFNDVPLRARKGGDRDGYFYQYDYR